MCLGGQGKDVYKVGRYPMPLRKQIYDVQFAKFLCLAAQRRVDSGARSPLVHPCVQCARGHVEIVDLNATEDSMRTPLLETIRQRPLLADGAMGTQLMIAGLEQGHCGEQWNL